MGIPFYADAEKLSSKGPNFNRVWTYILGLVWIVTLGYFFSYVETQDSLLLKSLANTRYCNKGGQIQTIVLE